MTFRRLVPAMLCGVLLAGVAFGQTGEVYSLNVVGFQKITAASQGLTMVSMPFDRSPNTLDDVIGSQLNANKSSTYADNVTFWDVAQQRYVTYALKTDGKWYDANNQPATNTSLMPGKGFWINNTQKLSNETVVVSGDVVDVPAVTNALVVGLNLVAYPFNGEVALNSSGLTNGYGNKSSTYADNVTFWDVASQRYVTYALKTDKIWYDASNNPATNAIIRGGDGLWYNNRSASTFYWVETRPYTL